MRMTSLLLVILLAGSPSYNTTGVIRVADPVERRIFASGVKPEQFYFSFSTNYRINGTTVTAATWWRTPKIGKTMQVKAVNRIGFWFVTAANLKEKP